MLFVQLVLVLLMRFGHSAPKHLIETVADRSCFVDRFSRRKITPCNPPQALLDLSLVQLLGLPPCGCAQGGKPDPNAPQSLFPGLCVGERPSTASSSRSMLRGSVPKSSPTGSSSLFFTVMTMFGRLMDMLLMKHASQLSTSLDM